MAQALHDQLQGFAREGLARLKLNADAFVLDDRRIDLPYLLWRAMKSAIAGRHIWDRS